MAGSSTGGFVAAGVFVVDAGEERREGRETGADDADGDFGVSVW